jgi:hypothetical protein
MRCVGKTLRWGLDELGKEIILGEVKVYECSFCDCRMTDKKKMQEHENFERHKITKQQEDFILLRREE